MSGQQYALRFISGKYQGGEFPLKMDREVIIGRSSDLDMVLVEDMVSRRHAKITTHQEQVLIQDLGSTNGTFVNGEKIKRSVLKEGDRVLIGTSIIKLVAGGAEEGEAPGSASGGQSPMGSMTPRKTMSGPRSMQGTVDEIPLPDLLQLLSTSRKSGVLQIEGEEGVGRIYLREGQIYYATLNEGFDINPRKAIYRMLVWQSGNFELQPPDDKEFLEELSEPTEGLLMEAMRQLDEMKRLEEEGPSLSSQLSLARPMVPSLRDLSPEQLDMLQTVHNHGQMRLVLDHSPSTDLETFETIAQLIKDGYLEEDGAGQ